MPDMLIGEKPTLATAEAEYIKDSKLRRDDVAQLREWLKKQPHLPQHTTDEFLIAILHSSEYSVEQAKQLLELNITCRTSYSEMFSNKDPYAKDKRAVWKYIDFALCPKLTEEKYRIVYIGFQDPNPDLFDFPSVLNVCMSALDSMLHELGVCSGYVIILNAQGVTLTHLAKASISYIRNILYFVQEAISIKIKQIHVINVSPVVDKIMFVAKPFLKKSLLEMLYFHSGEMAEFYEAVPKHLLPRDLGGSLGSLSEVADITKVLVERNREWLMQLENLRTDDNKRPDKKTDNFSVAGSFRKLELD